MQVLHPRLEGGELPAVIRETRPANQPEQPEQPGELLVELAPARGLPAVDEVRDEVGDIGEIGLGVADHLIGDRNTAVSRVSDLGRHRRIFSPGRPRAQPWSDP